MLVETHVLQHHNTGQEQSSGVCEALASNIGSRAVNGLEDGAFITNVTGRSEAETTDQAGAHVGQNVTVQVGHDKDLVVVRSGIGNDLQARVVQQLSIKLDIGELLGNFAGSVEEQTIGHLHDGGLVHNTDLLLVDRTSVLEGETENPLRSFSGDELDALDNTIDNNVLNARVFTLGVLTNQNSIDVVVRSFVTGDRAAGTQVRKQVESTTESKVKGNMTLANRSLQDSILVLYLCGPQGREVD